MTDEQINQLFDLKQKLDAGAISHEVFDKEVSALKGEVPKVTSNEALSLDKVEKLQQLKVLFEDGLISLEEMDKLRDKIVNEKPAAPPAKKIKMKESGFNWWIVVGVVVLVAIIVVLAFVNFSKESTATTCDDYTEEAFSQTTDVDPVYQEPEEESMHHRW